MNLIAQEFQSIVAIATTPTAAKLLQPICQTLGATLMCMIILGLTLHGLKVSWILKRNKFDGLKSGQILPLMA